MLQHRMELVNVSSTLGSFMATMTSESVISRTAIHTNTGASVVSDKKGALCPERSFFVMLTAGRTRSRSRPDGFISSTEGTMSFLAWIVVGLVAGVLASLVMGGTGYGIIGDIIIGIVGAFIGGWLFSTLGISSPFGGMGGTIFVAFIGAVVLLFILRLIRGSTRRV